MKRETQALVIGGGPSGLSVAYALQGETLVVEKEDSVGGLCRSITHEGGVFDLGGHSFHTPHPEVLELVEKVTGGLDHQKRDARVFTHGTLIPYPFQRSYDQIPDPRVVRECEEGLRNAAGDAGEARNFEEYIIRKFGQGIADHFMLPYNRKLWARDIRQVSCEWTGERVAAPKGEKESFDTKGGERRPLQPDTVVSYPREGGFERIFEAFVPHVPEVELNRTIVRIDPETRTATAADGAEYGWEFLVSTLPLPILLRIVDGVPDALIRAAERLEYMSLRVELLLVGHRLETSIQRIYSADPEIPPHKIALNHNSSDSLRARPVHAISAEVSISRDKPVDVEQIAPRTVDLLCRVGVLDAPSDVVWRDHVDVKYAYPVYTHDRPAILATIREWLEARDIHTLGRFGEWEYINSDKCVAKGLRLGRALKDRYALDSPINA